MTDSTSTKLVIITANYDTYESYNTSMDAMYGYAQNAGVEDLWEGTDQHPTRVIEDPYDPKNEYYDPITGGYDREASLQLLHNNQEERNREYEKKIHKRERRVRKLLTILTNWLQGSSEKQLLKRLRIEDDEWIDVIQEIRQTHGQGHIMGSVRLLEEFNALTIKRGQNFKEFISKLSDSLSKLREAGQTISQDQQKLKLINNAPANIKSLLQFHMSQGKTYEQLRREALAWSPQQTNNEISANSTTMIAGRGGGRFGRGYRGRGGGRSQTRGQTQRDDHKNRIYGQEHKDRQRSTHGGRGGRTNQTNYQNTTNTMRCYNCNSNEGHKSIDCPHPCNWCHKPGHSQTICRHRLAGRPRTQINKPNTQEFQSYPTSYTLTLPMPPPPPLPTSAPVSSDTSTLKPGVQFNFGSIYRQQPSGSLTTFNIEADSSTLQSHLNFKEIVTDGCATYNLWADREDFTEYYPLNDTKLHATSSGGDKMQILGFGAVGGLHHVFHVEGLVKNLVSLAYISNVLKYTYVGSPGQCILYDRDLTTPIWTATIDDDSLLPKLNKSDVLNAHLTMPDGSEMQSTPQAMGLSSYPL